MTLLSEEQRSRLHGVIERNETFYCYRLPNESSLILVTDATAIRGVAEGGFVVSDFDNDSTLTITDRLSHTSLAAHAPKRILTSNTSATLRSEHQAGVEHIVRKLNDIGYGKCVLSRLIAGTLSRPISYTFEDLLSRYPSAFIFLYNSAPTGMWIGATPETLLRSKEGQVVTMSLAGTRKAGTEEQWDAKNLEEQDIVTQYILQTLSNFGFEPSASELMTRQAGPVEHLCRIIHGSLPAGDLFSLSDLLMSLSPTPALGGYPKDTALRLISQCERHPRQCYGGYIGPYHDRLNFDFFVNLRSARLFPTERRYAKIVGGGITRFSQADEEWNETTLKAQTMML